MGFERAKKIGLTLIVCALVIAIISLLLVPDGSTGMMYSFIAVVAFVVLGLAVIIRWCRCPNCGKVLMVGLLKVQYCPKCKHSVYTGKTKKQEKKSARK